MCQIILCVHVFLQICKHVFLPHGYLQPIFHAFSFFSPVFVNVYLYCNVFLTVVKLFCSFVSCLCLFPVYYMFDSHKFYKCFVNFVCIFNPKALSLVASLSISSLAHVSCFCDLLLGILLCLDFLIQPPELVFLYFLLFLEVSTSFNKGWLVLFPCSFSKFQFQFWKTQYISPWLQDFHFQRRRYNLYIFLKSIGLTVELFQKKGKTIKKLQSENLPICESTQIWSVTACDKHSRDWIQGGIILWIFCYYCRYFAES